MSDYIVRFPTGAYVSSKGGDSTPSRDIMAATRMTLAQAANVADAVGGGVAQIKLTKKGDTTAEPVDIGGDGTPRRFQVMAADGAPPRPDGDDERYNDNGYPKAYAPDPLPIETPAKRRARKAAAVDTQVYGEAIHGSPDDEQPDLISAEVAQ